MAGLAEQLGREFEARVFLAVAISEEPERDDLRQDLRRLMSQKSKQPTGSGRTHLQTSSDINRTRRSGEERLKRPAATRSTRPALYFGVAAIVAEPTPGKRSGRPSGWQRRSPPRGRPAIVAATCDCVVATPSRTPIGGVPGPMTAIQIASAPGTSRSWSIQSAFPPPRPWSVVSTRAVWSCGHTPGLSLHGGPEIPEKCVVYACAESR